MNIICTVADFHPTIGESGVMLASNMVSGRKPSMVPVRPPFCAFIELNSTTSMSLILVVEEGFLKLGITIVRKFAVPVPPIVTVVEVVV